MGYMDLQDIKETAIWELYDKGRNYHRLTGIYTDTDRNYRMFNGDQWNGAKLGGIEPVQKNFIEPIVKYKIAVIHDNLYALNYSSQNYENPEFQREAKRYCDMLNRYAHNVWEQDKMDFKLRRITKDAAINDEGIIYIDFDQEKMRPINEIVKKNDIYYGNENDDDIQAQPYILIRKRMSVSNAVDFALNHGASMEDTRYIVGDNDVFDESGEAAKQEVNDGVTVVYKFYKKDGTVRFSIATRYVDITEDNDTGLSLYPIAHFVWEEKEGSARGEGEVRYLIPNQIEVNKTEMRRLLSIKNQAYPMKVVDMSKVANPAELDTVGGTIHTNGQPIDDVHKIVGYIPPVNMSPDVVKFQEDMIQITRELAGAGETATGQVNPEAASGRAILAVQQASQAPMTEQKETCKNFCEDIGRIWNEYLVIFSVDGIDMEEEVTDPRTNDKVVRMVKIPQSVMQSLKATVKIDVTPKGVYDKFAQEQTIENLLTQGFFNAQRLSELKAYVDSLDDDSVAPKLKLQEVVEHIEEEQRKIAMIQAKAQMMKQRVEQFLMQDVDGQSQQIADAQMQLAAMQGQNAPQEAIEGEEEVEAEEKAMDEREAAREKQKGKQR